MDEASKEKETESVNTIQKLAELRDLQSKLDAIRRELGIEPPGTVTFLAPRSPSSDDKVVVLADGFGGATMSIVEGNYPLDFSTKFERFFPNEKDAQAAAEELSFHGATPSDLLGAPI